uniref:Uncharacterized protein n=1 Tax=Vespula pensylvanica TaxID=30213 RepID=A0A834P3E0_VESPE|nr:hypothetical protein H0235_006636 [Vespula pensylvanica]
MTPITSMLPWIYKRGPIRETAGASVASDIERDKDEKKATGRPTSKKYLRALVISLFNSGREWKKRGEDHRQIRVLEILTKPICEKNNEKKGKKEEEEEEEEEEGEGE